MRKKMAAVGALALAATALGVALASPAQAAQRVADCKTGTYQITNRPDSGAVGNWALDTFTRKIEVCRVEDEQVTAKTVTVPSWTYLVRGTDEGTFVTQGTHTPKGLPADPAKFPGRTGQFTGRWSLKVEAPSEWQYWVGGKETNTLATGEWIAALWSEGDRPAEEFTDWSWTYTLCGKAEGPTPPGTRWVNANKHNSGDITGKFECAKPEVKVTPPTCADATSTVTVKNVNKFSKITVTFNDGKPRWVKPGESTSYQFTEGTVEVRFNREPYGPPVRYVPVKNCETPPPTTAPPAPGTGGGDDEELPKTGFSATDAALGGGALVLVAAAVLGGLWWYHRRTRVTFTA